MFSLWEEARLAGTGPCAYCEGVAGPPRHVPHEAPDIVIGGSNVPPDPRGSSQPVRASRSSQKSLLAAGIWKSQSQSSRVRRDEENTVLSRVVQ